MFFFLFLLFCFNGESNSMLPLPKHVLQTGKLDHRLHFFFQTEKRSSILSACLHTSHILNLLPLCLPCSLSSIPVSSFKHISHHTSLYETSLFPSKLPTASHVRFSLNFLHSETCKSTSLLNNKYAICSNQC